MKLRLFIAAAILLAGCDARTSKPSQESAQAAVSNFRYAQDQKTGLCFAVMDSSHFGSATDTSMTVTWVPCEPKVLSLAAAR